MDEVLPYTTRAEFDGEPFDPAGPSLRRLQRIRATVEALERRSAELRDAKEDAARLVEHWGADRRRLGSLAVEVVSELKLIAAAIRKGN